MAHLMNKKTVCHSLCGLAFVMLSYSGQFKKGHCRYNLDIWWGTEGKSLFEPALESGNRFCVFHFDPHKLLSFAPCVENDPLLQDTPTCEV